LQAWQTVELKGVALNSGVNKLRVYADKGGFNLRAMQFMK
jgi:endoglucanase